MPLFICGGKIIVKKKSGEKMVEVVVGLMNMCEAIVRFLGCKTSILLSITILGLFSL